MKSVNRVLFFVVKTKSYIVEERKLSILEKNEIPPVLTGDAEGWEIGESGNQGEARSSLVVDD